MSETVSAAEPAVEAIRPAIGEWMDAVDRILCAVNGEFGSGGDLHRHLEALHILTSSHGSLLGLHRKHVRRLAALERATRFAARLRALLTRLETIDGDPDDAGRDWLRQQLSEALADEEGRLASALPRRWKRTSGRMRRVLSRGRSEALGGPTLAAATVTVSRPRLAELDTALGRLHDAEDHPHILAARLAARRLDVLWSPLTETEVLRTRMIPLAEALTESEELAGLLTHIRRILPETCEDITRQRLDAALTGTAMATSVDRVAGLVEFARAVHAQRQKHFDTVLAPLAGEHAARTLSPLAGALERLEQDTRSPS
ncbi:MAG: hypothetical protein ACQERR_02525 [Pseudomonadota bacterium]